MCSDLLAANTCCCVRCALPLTQSAICLECQRHPPPWKSCRAPWIYEEPVKRWLRNAKFHEDMVALRGLLQAALATKPPNHDVVCPIPMPAKRLKKRGLNLAAELGRAIAQQSATTFCQALSSHRTTQQSHQSRRQRLSHGINRFQTVRSVDNQIVLLVDDVMTTGATLRAGTNSLLRAGAREVHVFSLLRTPRHKPRPQAQP